ncbi:SUMF1/EgtB/PvdO family nonheme iron enzyme [Borreliella lusitaniae]|uniref:SUMF1/EgtB/PvdO family nonheme iron enzyme n=1 Tax=Borreliella lusitaniae TaxID=100177 RepID=UPI002931965F|nr:SUMF1/EgtB/PvdO family nonheme iron enzyme [Borreliella lusitaniae]WNY66426.1 SUMF1/EgtB/PvdO family nonheme iron enzyme [Borreliella lusitaniae]
MKEIDKNSNIELFEVKLKPILGIAPKIYVFFTTIILLLSLISILIIIPKFKNPGAYLKINSNIANTYIYLNEKYIGRTPLNKYINTTEGIIKAKRIGFKTYEQKIKIHNKFFGSYNLKINLELVDPEKIIKQRQKELSIMVRIKNTNENTKLIPVFSLISSELKEHPKYIKKFLKDSIPYLNSIEMFKDFLNSYKAVYSINQNNSNQEEIWESLKINFDLENRAIFWFLENLDKDLKMLTKNEPWVKALTKTLDNENIQLISKNEKINIKLPGFKKINSNKIEKIHNFELDSKNISLKSTYDIKEFLIQEQNVTKYEYQDFLKENPKWTLNNKENLIKEQLVDDNYLKNFNQIGLNEAITEISYFSAIEYANWYSKKLPKGFKARLPISQEWELYQKEPNKEPLNINEISKKVGFWNLMQNPTFNDIAIFKNEKNFYNENSNFYSLITEIRTYSYQNNNLLNPSTKGSFLKNWSSPNIGFRLIISKE